MRFLGIDYGRKKVGLAVSDESGKLAFPYKVLANSSRLVLQIAGIIGQEGIEKIILGQSLNYENQPNPIMAEIEDFKNQLEKIVSPPVVFESEFLTTRQARRTAGKGKAVDAGAAALILQSYLDRQNAHAL